MLLDVKKWDVRRELSQFGISRFVCLSISDIPSVVA